MTDFVSRLAQLGHLLPTAPKPLASYVPAVRVGNMVYISGQVPIRDGVPMATGSVPDEVSVERAQELARQCALNGLAALTAEVGSINRVVRVVRLGSFVASAPGFADQPKVTNGASDLLRDLFGEAGQHARAAVGVTSLPLNVPVEIEFLFEVE